MWQCFVETIDLSKQRQPARRIKYGGPNRLPHVILENDHRAEAKVRVTVQQPTLTKYRIPVFSALAAQPLICLNVLYGERPEWPNETPKGFSGVECRLRVFRVLGQLFFWHAAQFRATKNSESDVAILTWNSRYLSLVPALLLAKIRGTKTLLWGHGYSKSEKRISLWARTQVAKLADGLLFYDRQTADYYEQRGFESTRVFAASNALDQDPIAAAASRWKTNPADLEQFAAKWNLVEKPVLLYCSRLDPANRVDRLLDAVDQLSDEFPNLTCVIIGGGREEIELLAEQASRLQISDRCIFTGPIYSEQELAPWFLSAKIFVYPENIGLSLLHAFGYGLPVITSDAVATQNPEIRALKPYENGLLYQKGSVDALVKAIASLLRDERRREQMGGSALATVTNEYSLQHMVATMTDAILSVSSKSDAPR